MTTNYIALAIPFFFLLIGIELAVSAWAGRKVYRLDDSINDLSCGILQQIWNIFMKAALFLGYLWIYTHFRQFDLGPEDTWVWVAGFIAVDFLYYWFHRSSHEVNFLWGAHIVHHQSEEYNLTVALRQSLFQGVFSSFFYWPLAFLGFHPVVFLTLSSFNTLYQFWIHTRLIKRLGPLEWFLNTPSHHRVHHGRNPQYIDRNHGGTLIIWDRLFGTFEPEGDEVVYGITKPLASWNPIWANFHYWVELWQVARRSSWVDGLRMFLKPPGWFPAHLGGFQPPPAVPIDIEKYGHQRSGRLALYLFLQFAVVIIWVSVFIFTQKDMRPFNQALFACTGVIGLISLGLLSENRLSGYLLEWVRIPSLVVILVFLTTDSRIHSHFAAPFASSILRLAPIAFLVVSLVWLYSCKSDIMPMRQGLALERNRLTESSR